MYTAGRIGTAEHGLTFQFREVSRRHSIAIKVTTTQINTQMQLGALGQCGREYTPKSTGVRFTAKNSHCKSSKRTPESKLHLCEVYIVETTKSACRASRNLRAPCCSSLAFSMNVLNSLIPNRGLFMDCENYHLRTLRAIINIFCSGLLSNQMSALKLGVCAMGSILWGPYEGAFTKLPNM